MQALTKITVLRLFLILMLLVIGMEIDVPMDELELTLRLPATCKERVLELSPHDWKRLLGKIEKVVRDEMVDIGLEQYQFRA